MDVAARVLHPGISLWENQLWGVQERTASSCCPSRVHCSIPVKVTVPGLLLALSEHGRGTRATPFLSNVGAFQQVLLLGSPAWPILSQSCTSGSLVTLYWSSFLPLSFHNYQICILVQGSAHLCPLPSLWNDTHSRTWRDTEGKICGNTFIV